MHGELEGDTYERQWMQGSRKGTSMIGSGCRGAGRGHLG